MNQVVQVGLAGPAGKILRQNSRCFITNDVLVPGLRSGNIIPALGNIPTARGRDRDLIYLLQLARKHNLSLIGFHDSLLVAGRRGKAHCKGLQIEIRSRGEASSTYMFSVKSGPLAQATIQIHSIRKLKKLPPEYSSLWELNNYGRDGKREGELAHSKGMFGLGRIGNPLL